jgi:hypothetical protein
VALLRRVVSPLGAALIASPNADAKAPLLQVESAGNALGYYELYETIAGHFESVRMIGQAPFVGYAVAELSVEDPEPTIDSSLAESEGKEPDWLLALASDRPLRLDPFALIELPVQLFSAVARREQEDDVVTSPVPESGPASGTVLLNILEAEREAALESLRQQEQALQAERFRADRLVQELAAAREEVDLLRERCRAMEERISDEEAKRSTLETQLDRTRHDPELAALRERLRAAEQRVAGWEDSARSLADEREAEIAQLETQLRDRGREIQELHAEVDRRDKLVRELVVTNFSAHASVASDHNGLDELANGETPSGVASHGADDGALADLSARLDRLARDAARREADLVGAKWRIAQLERELGQQR